MPGIRGSRETERIKGEEKVECRGYEAAEKQKELYITKVRQRKGWALKEQVEISQ